MPPAAPFSHGTVHVVRLVARDLFDRVVTEVDVTVESSPHHVVPPVTGLDIELSLQGPEGLVVVKGVPQDVTAIIALDGVRVHGTLEGRSTSVRFDPERGHVLVLVLNDVRGNETFRQQFCIPRFRAPAMVATVGKASGCFAISATPPVGISYSISVDQSIERTLDRTVLLTPHEPHVVTLKQYATESSSSRISQVDLQLPLFIDEADIEEIIRYYTMFSRNWPVLMQHLVSLSGRTKSPLLKKLLMALASIAQDRGGADELDRHMQAVTAMIREIKVTVAPPNVVHFRLKGREDAHVL